MKKQLKKRPKRHSLLTRGKWWIRARWRWFRGLRWWQKTLLIGGPLVVVALIIPLLTYAYFAMTMGDIEHLMNRNNTGVVLKDIHGEVFYSTGNAEHRPPFDGDGSDKEAAAHQDHDKRSIRTKPVRSPYAAVCQKHHAQSHLFSGWGCALLFHVEQSWYHDASGRDGAIRSAFGRDHRPTP